MSEMTLGQAVGIAFDKSLILQFQSDAEGFYCVASVSTEEKITVLGVGNEPTPEAAFTAAVRKALTRIQPWSVIEGGGNG